MKPIRAFITIPLDEKTKTEVDNIIALLQRKNVEQPIRWIKKENLHLTVKFLGLITLEQYLEFSKKISTAIQCVNSFDLQLTTIACLPEIKHPRVVAIPVNPSETLMELFNLIELYAEESGISKETRSFFPHLTIGRVRNSRKFLSLTNIEFLPLNLPVNSIHFMQSIQGKTGIEYTDLHITKLNLRR